MPFKETKEGQTHSQNDNCGDPAHNDMTNCKECINCNLGLCPSDCPDDCDSQRCDKHKFPHELLVKEKKI